MVPLLYSQFYYCAELPIRARSFCSRRNKVSKVASQLGALQLGWGLGRSGCELEIFNETNITTVTVLTYDVFCRHDDAVHTCPHCMMIPNTTTFRLAVPCSAPPQLTAVEVVEVEDIANIITTLACTATNLTDTFGTRSIPLIIRLPDDDR